LASIVIIFMLCWLGLAPRWASSLLARVLHLPQDLVYAYTNQPRPFNFDSIGDGVVLGRLPRGSMDFETLRGVRTNVPACLCLRVCMRAVAVPPYVCGRACLQYACGAFGVKGTGVIGSRDMSANRLRDIGCGWQMSWLVTTVIDDDFAGMVTCCQWLVVCLSWLALCFRG